LEKNNLLIAAVVSILILGTLGFSQDVFADHKKGHPPPGGSKLAPTDVENFYFLDFPIDITGFTRTTAFGIMSDCTAKTIANNKIEEIPTVDCVFTVDEIRVFSFKLVDDNRIVTYDVLCIDKLKFTDSLEDWNSCSFLTQGDIEMGLGASIGVDVAIKFKPGSFWDAGPVSGISTGFNLVSADIPWTIGLPLKNIQGEYRDEFFGGNLLHDSGIGPVKARKFVVVAEEASGQKGSLGVDGRIQFLGKKPHDMELIVGVVVDNTPKCYSELDFTKDGKIDCRDDFKDALIGACHSCPIPGIFSSGATTPQIQNVAANFISPQSRPDAIVDNEQLEQILNDNIDEIISDFSLTLPGAMSDIAVDTVVAGFDEIDVDAIVDRLDAEIVKQLGKLEGALEDLKKEFGVTGDLSEVVKKLPQFEEDLKALEDNIKDIKDDVGKVGDSIDDLEKFFGFLNTAWTDFKGAIGV